MKIPWWLIIIGIIFAGFHYFKNWILIGICILVLVFVWNKFQMENAEVPVTKEDTIKAIEPSITDSIQDWLKDHTPKK